jgi:putative MATE family efflux protein
MNRLNELDSLPINKLLLKYSIPSVLSLIISSMYIIIDRIFIGNISGVGPIALVGIGMTIPITTILLSLSALIAVGAATNVSISLGQGNKEQANAMLNNAITMSFIIGVLFTVLYFFFQNSILQFFRISGEALPYAKDFINIIIIGSIFSIQNFLFPNLIRAEGNPKFAAILTIMGCILNIFLDVIFINFLNFGIKGAATATVISQFITVIIGFFYFTKGKSSLHFSKNELIPKLSIIKPMILIGAVPFLNQMAISLSQIFSNYSLNLYGGQMYIGSMAVISSVISFPLMLANGIGQANQTIVGYNYAKGQYDRAFKTFILSIFYSSIILLIGTIFIEIFPVFFIKLFTKDPTFMDITTKGIKLYSMLIPLSAICIISGGLFMVTGKVKTAIMFLLSRQCIIFPAVLYFLPKLMGTSGLWLSQSIADLLSAFIIIVLFFKNYKHLLTSIPRFTKPI